MNSKNLSVVISALNEENKIAKCLDSVKNLAEEIILVDNGSIDNTVKIALQYTKKIYSQVNDVYNIDLQKNLGIEKATSKWILVLDADEIVSDDLAMEIKQKLLDDSLYKEDSQVVGYEIPRKNIIFGKWIKHSGWYPDYQLRLFRNGKGKYEKKHVHEPLSVQGKIDKLTNDLIHYNYETVSQFFYKHFLLYAPNEAEELLNKGYSFDWKGVIRLPMSEFLSRYFAREGYRDGFHGLVLALLMASYHLSIFVYLWEKKKFIEAEKVDIMSGLKEELKKTKKELNYWINTKEINNSKNLLLKTTIKFKRKFNF